MKRFEEREAREIAQESPFFYRASQEDQQGVLEYLMDPPEENESRENFREAIKKIGFGFA